MRALRILGPTPRPRSRRSIRRRAFGRNRYLVPVVALGLALIWIGGPQASAASRSAGPSAVVADLDGDGRGERVRVVRTANGAAEVWITGRSGTSRIFGFGFARGDGVSIAARDLDADGDLDLLVANAPLAGDPSGGTAVSSAPAVGGGHAPTAASPAIVAIVNPAGGLPSRLDVGAGGSLISRSRAGDNDNFGYGLGTGPPPCLFYDNSEPEDLGVFDRELNPGDEVDVWEHAFKVLGEPSAVRLQAWEIFSDAEQSTIDLDGHTFNFASAPFAVCDAYPESGFRRVFVLSGPDASIAADGSITVTFSENGDDISLDKSRLVVKFA